MVRNNVIALLFYGLSIFLTQITSKLPRVYEFVTILTSLFLLICCVFIGRKLQRQNSMVKNLLSVSSVTIVGVILHIGYYLHLFDTSAFVQSRFYLPLMFLMYLPIYFNKFIVDIIIIVPTVLMWMGLEWKPKIEKFN